ncbi:uncharacterized protein A4U43_C04F24630 [Asparagus officinalis]|uniref:Uncharacterized protein n=1 Tax=Asparagus officinalis TaxID=4686 RepID=A0A5P1F3F8_ASPOF|nr:uncharacterized protein A4U43_C04F24630 [Asparagus officinalis]
MMEKRSPTHSTLSGETSDAIERALKGPEPGKTTLYLQGCTPLVCLWYYELTGIKKPAVGYTGPAAVDAGRARGPRQLLHKKKRRAEDDDILIDAVDIDEDVEQPNEAVEQMEWPQFSRALNKRKRGARGAREKVAAAAPLKRKRCKRTVKPSKWVVTPYTEGKKKKEKDNIRDKVIIEVAGEEEEQVQEKVAELSPARLQSDPHSILEKHMSSPISSEEEMYRNKLNEGIPFPGGFIIKFLGNKDTFVHNYKVPADVAALLTEEEKKTLNHFCICRCNK